MLQLQEEGVCSIQCWLSCVLTPEAPLELFLLFLLGITSQWSGNSLQLCQISFSCLGDQRKVGEILSKLARASLNLAIDGSGGVDREEEEPTRFFSIGLRM